MFCLVWNHITEFRGTAGWELSYELIKMMWRMDIEHHKWRWVPALNWRLLHFSEKKGGLF